MGCYVPSPDCNGKPGMKKLYVSFLKTATNGSSFLKIRNISFLMRTCSEKQEIASGNSSVSI